MDRPTHGIWPIFIVTYWLFKERVSFNKHNKHDKQQQQSTTQHINQSQHSYVLKSRTQSDQYITTIPVSTIPAVRPFPLPERFLSGCFNVSTCASLASHQKRWHKGSACTMCPFSMENIYRNSNWLLTQNVVKFMSLSESTPVHPFCMSYKDLRATINPYLNSKI